MRSQRNNRLFLFLFGCTPPLLVSCGRAPTPPVVDVPVILPSMEMQPALELRTEPPSPPPSAKAQRPAWANVEPSLNRELVETFGGTYRLKHAVSYHDGERLVPTKVESCIALALDLNGQPMLEMNAVSDNDHGCYFDLLASFNASRQIVLRADTRLYDHQSPDAFTCWYLVSNTGGRFEVTDSWAEVDPPAVSTPRHGFECERPAGSCGAGGQFMGMEFPMRSRRPKDTRCKDFESLRNR